MIYRGAAFNALRAALQKGNDVTTIKRMDDAQRMDIVELATKIFERQANIEFLKGLRGEDRIEACAEVAEGIWAALDMAALFMHETALFFDGLKPTYRSGLNIEERQEARRTFHRLLAEGKETLGKGDR